MTNEVPGNIHVHVQTGTMYTYLYMYIVYTGYVYICTATTPDRLMVHENTWKIYYHLHVHRHIEVYIM